MKTFLKILGGVALFVVLVLVSLFLTLRGAMHPGLGTDLPKEVRQVKGAFVNCYILQTHDARNRLVLVDAGADSCGAQILADLKAMGREPKDVAAIFLTHSHSDHSAGVFAFPKAQVFAMREEAPFAEGREAYQAPISLLAGKKGNFNRHPFKLTRGLKDGETVKMGKLSLTAYLIPGHTPGSAAFLAGGVLFLGDAANATKDGRLKGPMWIFSQSRAQGADSLKKLAIRLKPIAEQIRYITTAHGGNLQGFAALEKF